MDISALITEFGSYYRDGGQNMMDLLTKLRQGGELMQLCRRVNTKNTQLEYALTESGRMVQPFQKGWTPLAGDSMVPHTIKKFFLKADKEFYPDDLSKDTWLGFLESNNLDRKQWPFIRWYIEKEFLPQVIEDLELNELWGGAFAAPTPGTAGAAGTAMNGLKTVVAADIASGLINASALGAWSATDSVFVEELEDWAQSISELARNRPYKILMSSTLKKRFMRGYEDLYGSVQNYDGFGPKLRFTNWDIVGVNALGASQRVIAYEEGNLLLLQNKIENASKVRVENVDRLVKIYTDFDYGIGFKDPRRVYTNDQV
jgi:hypothetical protein